ncbi:MAG: tRNA (adenosine(37)-N6)-threonylcarbamoyltransferase complex transferase subunit TsaD [Bacteroidota bacterium]
MNKKHTILAIESSCDDTGASIIQDGQVLSNIIANQAVHKEYGGVVPEMASRAHQEQIIPIIHQALQKAKVELNDLDGIAFTRGPGLIGSLIVGVSFAKALALARNIPLIEVHHMQAHVLAHFAEPPYPKLPFLCLTVSGGHTQIVLVRSPLDMEVLGSTLDDAAGEAFDKTGKILGLDYPAGPVIDRLAQQGEPRFSFSKPRIEGLNFSFSGLKTGILYFLQAEMKKDPNFIQDNLADICASVQQTIVDILLGKLKRAAKETGILHLAIAGGVSANSGLRAGLQAMGEKYGWQTYIPQFEYCTDNAAMIGIAGYYKFLEGDFAEHNVAAAARWDFKEG